MVFYLLKGEAMITAMGNDKRSITALEFLNKNIVRDIGKDIVLLPIPASEEIVNETTKAAKESTLIFGAGVKNTRVYDLNSRDDFALLNAVPTAEGAIALAISNTDYTLFKSKILITGFGRVSRILINRLFSFGSYISVAVRKQSNIAEITAMGLNAVNINNLEKEISNYDIVFNTVPYCLFSQNVLSKARKNTLFIELASKKLGFENTDNINFINAPGLPAKFAPESAGEIYGQTVLNVLKEKNLI